MSKKKHKTLIIPEKSTVIIYNENCKYLRDNIPFKDEDYIDSILLGLSVAENEGLLSYLSMNKTVEYLIKSLIIKENQDGNSIT